jgi:osmotically-inducible protein OsmY
MRILMLVMLGLLQSAPQDVFLSRCDLQGVYDEVAQATLASRTAKDIDMFHDVFYTPGWVFIDGEGNRHTWNELRAPTIDAAANQSFTIMRQAIQEITLIPDGATALINFITIRDVVDNDGKYGPIGASHRLAEVTAMRDTWIKTAISWKLQVREQLGGTRVFVDKEPPDIERPRCPTT